MNTTTLQGILDSIDTSKMEQGYVDIIGMSEREFDIYECVVQSKPRLTNCYYHSWICTDTKVGICVWYLDGEAVCVSYQYYRKSPKNFLWISEECFRKVERYLKSLLEESTFSYSLASDEDLRKVQKHANSIDYKQFEVRNLRSANTYSGGVVDVVLKSNGKKMKCFGMDEGKFIVGLEPGATILTSTDELTFL